MIATNETVHLYRNWLFDRGSGVIVGIQALDQGALPAEHWRLIKDPRGRVVRIEEHRADLDTPAVKQLHYESEQSRQVVEARDYNPDGSLRLVHRYLYDPTGRVIDRLEFDGQMQSRGHVVSVWDEHGREVEEVVYDNFGRLQGRHQYGYDARGCLVLEKIFSPNGTLEGIRTLAYDQSERVIEKCWHDSQGQLKSRYCHEYSPDDQICRTRLFNKEGTLVSELIAPDQAAYF